MNETTSLVIVPKTFDEVQSMATVLATSELLPLALRKKPADVAMTIMTGQELGLSPMASIRMIHIIEGKPSLSADAMVAIVLASGKAEFFRPSHSDEKSCTYETVRKGEGALQKVTWTLENAKAAGLYPAKDNWRLHTRQMLAARAKAELARAVYPDVMAGVFASDEIEHSPYVAPASTAPSVVIDADFVDAPATPLDGDLLADIEASPDADALKQLGARCNSLPKGTPERKAAVAAYKAKLAGFESAGEAHKPEAVAS